MDILKLYNENLHRQEIDEISNTPNFKRYKSMSYEMETHAPIYYATLKKARYNPDKYEATQMRKSIRDEYNNHTRHQSIKLDELQKNGFKDFTDLEKQRAKEGLIYDIDVLESDNRLDEIIIYTSEIIKTATTILDNKEANKYKAICYLIDEQYKEHTAVITPLKDDLMHRPEINALIFDVLQKEISEIHAMQSEPIEATATALLKNRLHWNGKKQILPTLFGLLHDNGLIDGNKSDTIRGLSSLFDNLNANTITNNIGFKNNLNEAKKLYDLQTEQFTTDFINYAIGTIKKKNK